MSAHYLLYTMRLLTDLIATELVHPPLVGLGVVHRQVIRSAHAVSTVAVADRDVPPTLTRGSVYVDVRHTNSLSSILKCPIADAVVHFADESTCAPNLKEFS